MRIRLGFFLAKVLPPPFSTWSSGAAEIEELVPPQERSISSPSFPPLYILSFLSPTLSLISLSGTQSVSGSLSEFIISLRRPWPRWIRALKFFHQHLGEAGETVRETKCDKAQETHQRGVQLSLDWARRLKRVCTQACDKAKGQGRCQMRVGPWLTSDLTSKNKSQPKTRVGWCSSYVPFPHEKTRLMN